MKKIYSLISLMIIIITNLTGCFFNYEKVKIDGKTYKKDFYPSYLWVNSYDKDGDSVKIGINKYQKIINNKFELYHSDSTSDKMNGEIYCLDEQCQEAYNYYHDSNNYYFKYKFDSYIIKDTDDKIINNITFDNFDILATANDYDILNWKKLFVDKSDTLELSYEQVKTGRNFCIKGYTKDNLFVTATQKLFIYQNRLYYFVGEDGNYDYRTGIDGDDIYYYSPVSDEIQEYFLNAINNVN